MYGSRSSADKNIDLHLTSACGISYEIIYIRIFAAGDLWVVIGIVCIYAVCRAAVCMCVCVRVFLWSVNLLSK